MITLVAAGFSLYSTKCNLKVATTSDCFLDKIAKIKVGTQPSKEE